MLAEIWTEVSQSVAFWLEGAQLFLNFINSVAGGTFIG